MKDQRIKPYLTVQGRNVCLVTVVSRYRLLNSTFYKECSVCKIINLCATTSCLTKNASFSKFKNFTE